MDKMTMRTRQTPAMDLLVEADTGAMGGGGGGSGVLIERPQMDDIARLAGVSKATVSRALAGKPGINAKTRANIEALARSLNYSVNLGASNLRTKSVQAIAVAIPRERQNRRAMTDPFLSTMVGWLADTLTDAGFDMLLSRVDPDDLSSAAAQLKSGRAGGLILIGQMGYHDQLNALADAQRPVVAWGVDQPGRRYSLVGIDNVEGGRLAALHMLNQGRRRLGFVGNLALPEAGNRFVGFQRALSEAGQPLDSRAVLSVPFDADVAQAAVQAQWLDTGWVPDGVLCCSDTLGVGISTLLQRCGLNVPGDTAVVGFDDVHSVTDFAVPALSSVHQPIEKSAAKLVETVLAQLTAPQFQTCILPVHLVARASSQHGDSAVLSSAIISP
jgi:DNA-binding LacI/PurR family transcriptional regulator